jgi:hypothetical protein
MSTFVELTTAHTNRHPDFGRLHRWLTTMGVDTAQVVIPSTIKVTKTGVTVEEWIFNAEGKAVLAANGLDLLQAKVFYEGDPLPIPALENTKVWSDR